MVEYPAARAAFSSIMSDEVRNSPRHWVVLGAGILGLVIALRLAQRGHKVSILEAAEAVGGLTSSHRYGEYQWDRFYHVIESVDQSLLKLVDEIGLSNTVYWGTSKTNFYDGENLYPLNNALDFIKLPILSVIEKFRLGLTIVYGSTISERQSLENIPVDIWLKKYSGIGPYVRLWKPLLRSKLGDAYGRVSASFICSVMRRFYGAREGAAKKENFGYLAYGYKSVIDKLIEELTRHDVDIVTNAQVSSVNPGIQVELENGDSVKCDSAVLTIPSASVRSLCPGLPDFEKQQHDNIEYLGVVCLSVLVNAPLGDAYLTYITDDSLPFTTVIEMSSLVGSDSYDGNYLIYLPKYVPSDNEFLDYSDEQVSQLFIAGLKKMYPSFEEANLVASEISRARYVSAIPTLNYSEHLPPIKSSVANLYVCNSAQIVNASLSVDESISLAENFVADYG